jgi:hypothetical protein
MTTATDANVSRPRTCSTSSNCNSSCYCKVVVAVSALVQLDLACAIATSVMHLRCLYVLFDVQIAQATNPVHNSDKRIV